MKAQIILLTLLMCACTRSPEDEAREESARQLSDALANGSLRQAAAGQTGTTVSIPSDPRATYSILSQREMDNGNLEILTRRVGPSGESFARREINCHAGTVRYIGEGDSLEEAQADAPNPGEMTAPIAESITGVITAAACGR